MLVPDSLTVDRNVHQARDHPELLIMPKHGRDRGCRSIKSRGFDSHDGKTAEIGH